MEKYKKLISLILILAVAGGLYLGYKYLYDSGIADYSKEFIAGCLGAVITIFATAALLKFQSQSEVEKEQSVNVFTEKLSMYKEFIVYLNSIFNDGMATQEELSELISRTSYISLVCQPVIIEAIYAYVYQKKHFESFDYSEYYQDMNKKDKNAWKKWKIEEGYDEIDFDNDESCEEQFASRGMIISLLRDDLSNKKMPNSDENLKTMRWNLEQLFSLRDDIAKMIEDEKYAEFDLDLLDGELEELEELAVELETMNPRTKEYKVKKAEYDIKKAEFDALMDL